MKLFVGTVCHSRSQSPLQTSGENSNQDYLRTLSSLYICCMGSQSNGLSNQTNLGQTLFASRAISSSILAGSRAPQTVRCLSLELLGAVRIATRMSQQCCHNNAKCAQCIFPDCTSMNDLVMVNFAKATNLLENWTAQGTQWHCVSYH